MFHLKELPAIAVNLIECLKNCLLNAVERHCVKFSLLLIGLQLQSSTRSSMVQRMGFMAVLLQETAIAYCRRLRAVPLLLENS